MTPSAPKKFLFDTEFGVEEEPVVVETPKLENTQEAISEELSEPEFLEEIAPTFSEEELAEAREEGMKAGREAAIQDMTTALEQQMSQILTEINTQVSQLFDTYAKDLQEHSQNAIAVASVIVRKLFPALNMKHAMDEIEHIIAEAMQRTSRAPALLIKVPSKFHSAVEAKVSEMAELRGREGKINVVTDDTLGDGDILVEWEGGGILRDTTAMWEHIDNIIETNLGSDVSKLTEQAGHNSHEHEPDIEEKHGNDAIATEQEVVKQALVSENEENNMESPEIKDNVAAVKETMASVENKIEGHENGSEERAAENTSAEDIIADTQTELPTEQPDKPELED